MTQLRLLDRYAKLLRAAWLNPSSKEMSMAVHEFEHEYANALDHRFTRWQKESRQEEERDATKLR